MGRKHSFHTFREFIKKHVCFVYICLGVFAIILVVSVALLKRADKSFEGSADGVPAPHIERNGITYFYRGEVKYELPKGCEYIGEVFDSYSGYGEGYVNTEYTDVLYFRSKDWDVERDGSHQPYLMFIKE